MKSLKQELLEFVSTISTKEIKSNKNLRRKLKQINSKLIDSYHYEGNEILKFINKEMLLAE